MTFAGWAIVYMGSLASGNSVRSCQSPSLIQTKLLQEVRNGACTHRQWQKRRHEQGLADSQYERETLYGPSHQISFCPGRRYCACCCPLNTLTALLSFLPGSPLSTLRPLDLSLPTLFPFDCFPSVFLPSSALSYPMRSASPCCLSVLSLLPFRTSRR